MNSYLVTGGVVTGGRHINTTSRFSYQAEFMKKARWKKEEMELLRQNYTAPLPELAKMIPNRTPHSIATKAHRLRLLKQWSSRNTDGTFKRTIQPFSLENFDNGYIDADGRFRVYAPNHPRAANDGKILRAIIAYELYHNISVPKTMAIHHLDGNRLNDSKENLEMMSFGEHSTFHNEPRKQKSLVEKICKHCGKTFLINKWRLNQGNTRGTFCSQKCSQKCPRTEEHKHHISEGLKKAYIRGAR